MQMGQWLEGEYERLLVDKVKQLIKKCASDHRSDEPIDRRFRAFVSNLEIDDKASQACFQTLYERPRVCTKPRRTRARTITRSPEVLPRRRVRQQPIRADDNSDDPLRLTSPHIVARTLGRLPRTAGSQAQHVNDAHLNEESEAWLAEYAREITHVVSDYNDMTEDLLQVAETEGEEMGNLLRRNVRRRSDRDGSDELEEGRSTRRRRLGIDPSNGSLYQRVLDRSVLSPRARPAENYQRDTRRDGVIFPDDSPAISLPPTGMAHNRARRYSHPVPFPLMPLSQFLLEEERQQAGSVVTGTAEREPLIDFSLDEESTGTGPWDPWTLEGSDDIV